MPRVTRKRVSALQSPVFRFAGAALGGAGLLALGAILFGMTDKGAIDVAGKINATDQSGFATVVNPLNNSASMANGGLQPMGGEAVTETAPAPVPEPAPTPATSTDALPEEGASATPASPEVASTTVNSGLTPSAE